MADRTSVILTLPVAPLTEEPTEPPNVVESGEVNVAVTVVTIKSGGGIQTVTTTP